MTRQRLERQPDSTLDELVEAGKSVSRAGVSTVQRGWKERFHAD